MWLFILYFLPMLICLYYVKRLSPKDYVGPKRDSWEWFVLAMVCFCPGFNIICVIAITYDIITDCFDNCLDD